MRRSWVEIETQEIRDHFLYAELDKQDNPYAEAPTDRSIRIGKKFYSPFWLLQYDRARSYGIACMESSAYFAMDIFMQKTGGHEHHDVTSRAKDGKLLDWAVRYLIANHLTRRPQGRHKPKDRNEKD